MAEFRGDQASGLRQLFVRKEARLFSFMAGSRGVGRTRIIANLALALVQAGRSVLVVDENSGRNDIATAFGLLTCYDYLHVLQSQRRIGEVVVQPFAQLYILPAGRAVQRLGPVSWPHYQFFLESISRIGRTLDFVLVDAASDPALGFSRPGLADADAQDTMLVLTSHPTAITDAYALLKSISPAPQRLFYTLINRPHHIQEAEQIHHNLTELAWQRHIASLSYAGAIPADDAMHQSGLSGTPLLLTAPESPAALACYDLAMRMIRASQPPAVQDLLHQISPTDTDSPMPNSPDIFAARSAPVIRTA